MRSVFIFVLLIMPIITQAQFTVRISTIAGDSIYGYYGDGGLATSAHLKKPNSICTDNQQNVYFIDVYNQRVRKIGSNGYISTIAGNGTFGFLGDGGPATAAEFNFPSGIAADTAGNVYIADWQNERIRKVNVSTGIITTFAGSGAAGYAGDGGPATAAKLWRPVGVAADKRGNIFISEQFNYCVRKVDPSGIITTVAGDGSVGYSGDGGPATLAKLNWPVGVAVDKHNNMYIADCQNNVVRKVDSLGTIHTYAGNGVMTFAGDGWAATTASMYYPAGVALDSSENLYIADFFNNRIRVVNSSGIINTLAGTGVAGWTGDGGPATASTMDEPMGVAVDTLGNVVVADFLNNCIRKIKLHCLPHAGKINGTSPVCPCFPVRFTAQLPNGVWSMSNSHATINDSGWVHGISGGIDTVIYTVQDSCGTARVIAPITILSSAHCDSMMKITADSIVCLDSVITASDSMMGGTWSSATGNAHLDAAGNVLGVTVGLDTIKYNIPDSCGYTVIKYPIRIVRCDTGSHSGSFVPINNHNNAGNVHIIPNPASDRVSIITEKSVYQELELIDEMGRTILLQPIQDVNTQLDISRLKTGIYILRFKGERTTGVRKLVKD